MITKEELKKITRKSSLNPYQQEKDYLLKLYLYHYYTKFDHAVFKGGTCMKYLYGLNRFSEDLDFNLKTTPKKYRNEVKKTLKEIRLLGINNKYLKEEIFKEAYTCEIAFQGPLSNGRTQTRNKFRIDAGTRTGIINEPRWELITSEYPETPQNFLILSMEEHEILAEKIIALIKRNKGRDLYDVWFLLKKGVSIDQKLIEKKAGEKQILTKIKTENLPTKQEYERDMKRLTPKPVPYKQIIKDITKAIQI